MPDGTVVHSAVEEDRGDWREEKTRTLIVDTGDGQRRVLRVAHSKAGAVRLEREAWNLRELAGARVPRLLAGPHDLGGRTVLEVECVAGPTLRDRLSAGSTAEEILRCWGSALLSTMEDLERAAVFHRDVTPDHIVLRRLDDGEELVVVDFSQSSISLGDRAGTLAYRGYPEPGLLRYDHAAERGMVALTLHEMVTGRLVWDDYLHTHRFGPFPAALDHELTVFFKRALGHERRFDSASKMRRAWERVFDTTEVHGDDEPTVVEPDTVEPLFFEADRPADPALTEDLDRRRTRSLNIKLVAIALVLLIATIYGPWLVVVVTLLGWLWWLHSK